MNSHTQTLRISSLAALVVSIVATILQFRHWLGTEAGIAFGTVGSIPQLLLAALVVRGWQRAPEVRFALVATALEFVAYSCVVAIAEVSSRPSSTSALIVLFLPIYVVVHVVGCAVLFAISLCVSSLVLRAFGRREAHPHCENCGYDLFRNESGRCPECGSKIEPVAATARAKPAPPASNGK